LDNRQVLRRMTRRSSSSDQAEVSILVTSMAVNQYQSAVGRPRVGDALLCNANFKELYLDENKLFSFCSRQLRGRGSRHCHEMNYSNYPRSTDPVSHESSASSSATPAFSSRYAM